jgi:D-alanyl-lipoteichoic acid acyltransferase DltB (MBOAT superfamily)
MVLTSFSYLIFLAVSLVVYYIFPKRMQYICLLVESVVFYCLSATPWTILYLIGGIAVSYLATVFNDRMVKKAKNSEQEEDGKKAARLLKAGKAAVVFGVTANIACLVLLKYLNLFIETANSFASLFSIETGWGTVNWVASLGLSFYTLQLIGYILDCYWGTVEPEHNFAKMALFACYFPEMTSGPIVRFEDVKDQLYAPHKAEYKRIVYGLWRILWGFFKKIVIANNLASLVDFEYNAPFLYQGLNVWLGTAAFCIQLYADFSGCMDIIMGTSECFGIHLPENFQAPFFSRSIQEFWRRWHITLGAWLRDYIMNPILKSEFSYQLKQRSMKLLGKKRGKKVHVYVAMFVLWMAMGLWHGSSWKYAIGEGLWESVFPHFSKSWCRHFIFRRRVLAGTSSRVSGHFSALWSGWYSSGD